MYDIELYRDNGKEHGNYYTIHAYGSLHDTCFVCR